MGIFSGKTAEEKAAAEARKQAERERQAYEQWLHSPPGRARQAHDRGDVVFQCAINLASHEGLIAPMAGGMVTTRDTDPSSVLNQICGQGWDLINGTVVFVPGMQESRDKFLASGQQVAVSGTTVGYYLFRRRG